MKRSEKARGVNEEVCAKDGEFYWGAHWTIFIGLHFRVDLKERNCKSAASGSIYPSSVMGSKGSITKLIFDID